jgi:hypothetical protein
MQVHVTAAAFTKIREFELERAEAEKLAMAAANVARWYAVPTLAQKTLDWVTLGTVVAGLYGPRVGAIQLRRVIEGAQRKQAAQTAAAARQGVPIVQADNRPVAPVAPPVAPAAPPARKGGNGKSPPLSADVGLSLEDGGAGLSNAPLAMITPESGFSN